MGRKIKYSAELLAKYAIIMKELEDVFVKPGNGIIEFDFRKFLRERRAASCLQVMFSRLGYLDHVSINKYKVLKAHPFQSMARNPEEALQIITDYGNAQRFHRSDNENRIPPPPIEDQVKYTENPFEEETEIPDKQAELADNAVASYYKTVTAERMIALFNNLDRVIKAELKDLNIGLLIEGKYTLLHDLFSNSDLKIKMGEQIYPTILDKVRWETTRALEELIKKRKEDNTDGKEN